MAFLQKKNNAKSLVTDNPLTAGAVTVNITGGTGSKFPATGDFMCTIWDSASYTDPGDDSNMEIVRATARTADAITITRAQEGTTGVSHAQGSAIMMLITAGTLDEHLNQNVKTTDSPTFVSVNGIGSNLTLERIGSSTYSTVQHLQDIFHSAGHVSGGVVLNNGDGTVAVTAGTGLIRPTNSSLDTVKFFDWAANLAVSLTDNDENYIYIDYNAGTPQITVSTTTPTEHHTKILLADIYRNGTDLHINPVVRPTVGDHAANMIQQMQETMPYARVSGAIIGETGTRNISVTVGNFWHGLYNFTTPAFDSSGVDTFKYYYRDGIGGWTEATAQTQVNNTQYDDGDGTLGTLTANRYGVHWVYLAVDGDVYIIFGQGDYTLALAQSASAPATIPEEVQTDAFIIGKIIIQKSSATFYSIESVYSSMFNTSGVTVHNDLSGIQGGTTSEYYHLTSAEYTATATTGSGNMARLTSPQFTTPNIGAATATSIAIGANTLDTNEWAFLDGQDQAVKTSNSPTFTDLTLTGGDLIASTATTFNLFNTVATTLNIGGVATAINLSTTASDSILTFGANAGGTRTIYLNVGSTKQGALTFRHQGTSKWALYSTDPTDNLRIYSYTNTADLITFAPTTITMGSALTTITPGATTFNLLNTVSTTVNAFGAATTLNIGAATGTMTVANASLSAKAITATTSVTAPFFASNNADVADAGVIRLGNAETIAWEASPASTDVTITVDSSERFTVSAPISATTGYTIAGVAATGTILRGNGTNFVASTSTYIDAWTTGDLAIATGTNVIGRLADVAAGKYLRSGGVGVAPLWSTLVLPNAATANRLVYASATNTYGEDADLTFDGANLTVGTAASVVNNYFIASSAANKEAGLQILTPAGTTWYFYRPVSQTYLEWYSTISAMRLSLTGLLSVVGVGFVSAVGRFPFQIPFSIRQAKLPSAVTAATIDGGQNRDYALFDAAADEYIEFQFVMPAYYDTSQTVYVKLLWTAASATSGNCVWAAQLMATTAADAANLETDSFDTANTTTTAAQGTAGYVSTTTITMTNKDSVVAGDICSLRIYRDADNGADTMTGDAELAGVILESY